MPKQLDFFSDEQCNARRARFEEQHGKKGTAAASVDRRRKPDTTDHQQGESQSGADRVQR